MKRGDVVTVATGGGFGGKPRPAVIVQADQFDETSTVVVAPFTSTLTNLPLVRLRFQPNDENGLQSPCDLMADIVVTARRDQVDKVIGALSSEEMTRVDRALLAFLGLAG